MTKINFTWVFLLLLPTMVAAGDHSNVCTDVDPMVHAVETFANHGKEAAGKVFDLHPESCQREERVEITAEQEKTFVEVIRKGKVGYGYVIFDRQGQKVYVAHAMVVVVGARGL